MRNRSNGQRGVALLLTMFALTIITAIGLSMMYQTDTETAINANFRDQQSGYYAAAAGLEEARDRMIAGNAASITLPTALPGDANGVLYITNASGSETVAPWSTSNAYYDNEICKELDCGGSLLPAASPYYTSTTASDTYKLDTINAPIPYKWARLTRKINRSAAGTVNTMYVNGSSSSTSLGYQVCWNGTNEVAVAGTSCTGSTYPVYLLTTLAVTPNGTRRMVQYELIRDKLDISSFPGAMTLLGSNVSVSAVDTASGNNYHIEGNDHLACGATTLGSPVAAVGVTNNTDLTNVTNAIPNGRRNNYFNTVHATPDVENVSSALPSEFQSVSELEALLTTIKSKATQTFLPIPPATSASVSSLSNPGTSSSPQTIFVDGDLTLGGSMTGYGILVVTGTLRLGGDVGWKGIVLVVGQGILMGNGGGSNKIEGALLIAKTRDSSRNLLSSLGSPTYNWTGGGGNGIHYSTGCIDQAQTFSDYRVISARELLY